MQSYMKRIRKFGDYKAPTEFYLENTTHADGSYNLSTGMHKKQEK